MLWQIWGEQYQVSWPRKTPDRVYLRYGMFSNRERSSNHATGDEEEGISVYPAVLVDDGVQLAPDVKTCPKLVGQGRLVFCVTGKEVGTGSDGEPVLRRVRMLPYPIHVNCKR